MDLIIWTYIFGGATIFALVVGVFSVWNGRMTRRELGEVIERGDERARQLLERMDRRLEQADGRMERLAQSMQSLERHMEGLGQHMGELGERMDRRIQDMDRRHTELLAEIVKRAS